MLGYSLPHTSTARGNAPLDYKNICLLSLDSRLPSFSMLQPQKLLTLRQTFLTVQVKKRPRRKDAPPKPFQKLSEKADKTVTQAHQDTPGGPRRTEVCACLSRRLSGANRPCCDWNNPSRNVCLHRSAHSPK